MSTEGKKMKAFASKRKRLNRKYFGDLKGSGAGSKCPKKASQGVHGKNYFNKKDGVE